MSKCLCVSSTATDPLKQLTTCIQHPLTKAALFVIAFLLAGGAIASYFTALGTAAVTSFSIASLAAFIMACIVTCRSKVRESEPSKPSAPLDEPDSTPKPAPLTYSVFGEKPDIDALQAKIDAAGSNSNRLLFVVADFIQNTPSNLAHSTLVFEELNWPDENIKKKVLLKALSFTLQSHFVKSSTVHGLYNLLIIPKDFLGEGDFCEHPELISPILSEALGLGIKKFSESCHWASEHAHKGETDEFELMLCIKQSVECRFPASAIRPLFPYLKDLPGLTSLDLSDIGTKKGCGFQDEDVDLLLNILHTNPGLVDFIVNTQSMSKEGREDFEGEKERILVNRKVK